MKFVRLVENVKRGHANVYDGIIIKETEDEIELHCVDLDHMEIGREVLETKQYTKSTRTKDEVLMVFKRALIRSERKKNNAELDFEEAKLSYQYDLTVFNKFFKDEEWGT